MTKLTFATLLACAATLTVGSAAGAQTYSFDDPSLGSGFIYNPLNFTGATFNAKSGVSGQGSPFFGVSAADGTQAAFIQSTGDGVGTVSLAFTGLSIGSAYSASFYLAARGNTYPSDPLLVSFDGIALGTYTPTSLNFTQFTTGPFVATATSGNLLFTGAPTTTGDDDTNIDAVSLSRIVTVPGTVPEPATWAMMILGMGAVGFSMRRRPAVTARVFRTA